MGVEFRILCRNTCRRGRIMIRISEISFPPEHSQTQLIYEASRLLRIPASKICNLQIVRRSVDARKKPDVRIVYTVDVLVEGNDEKIIRNSKCKRASVIKYQKYKIPKVTNPIDSRPVVVGFGPAGMFAALLLSLTGLRPIILERGEDVDVRYQKVQRLFNEGVLDPESNVQFGEGGAGTFSDGKLNTGVKNIRICWILNQLVEAGANESILYDAKPHVGTDVLINVVRNLRQKIISLGGEVRFCSKVTDIIFENGSLKGLEVNHKEIIDCDHAIFAIGHSARDTFSVLHERNVPMEPKPFSMGVRIEHLQRNIDHAQYGIIDKALPPADYKLVRHLEDRTVYTFCMCPGGHVVAAASEEGGVVTNGMSYSERDGKNANAALLVTVNPKDFPGDDPLAGVRWQREIEQKAFRLGGGAYRAPAQLVGDFLAHRPSSASTDVEPTYRPSVTWCDLHHVLPQIITASLAQAIVKLNESLSGFADDSSVLTAPETRSSSPVRIMRNESKQSPYIKGLYLAGEGAGYAGGIMSAAVDGMLCAEAIIQS